MVRGCVLPRQRGFPVRWPLKKKVTWAYFSVSAMRSCRLLARAMTEPHKLGMFCERVSGG